MTDGAAQTRLFCVKVSNCIFNLLGAAAGTSHYLINLSTMFPKPAEHVD